MKRSIALTLVVTGLLGLSTLTLHAKEKKSSKADMDAMMATMQKNMSPNANHQALQPLVGKWTYTASWWMKPGEKPEVSPGTAENTMILSGRYLKQEVKGTAMGKPFEGLGFTGYDVIRGEYASIWMDDMNTAIMEVTGQMDAASKTLNQSGTASCPMTGEKNRWGRSEWKINTPDQNTFTMYSKDETGKEFKTGEIVYTRAK